MKKTQMRGIKINKAIGSYGKGATATIKCDMKGIPVARYWRDRLKDAKIDKCFEFTDGKYQPVEDATEDAEVKPEETTEVKPVKKKATSK